LRDVQAFVALQRINSRPSDWATTLAISVFPPRLTLEKSGRFIASVRKSRSRASVGHILAGGKQTWVSSMEFRSDFGISTAFSGI
jgi:hypothetical protein